MTNLGAPISHGVMKLVFIYGQAGVGKLTVGRELADLTGMALFHNHLVVDAVGAVFPFGSESFIKLRERFWLDVFAEAASTGRSMIFTFAPESSVCSDFPERVRSLIQAAGGELQFIRLIAPVEEQERRIAEPSRAAFGKLRSLDLLRELRPQFDAALAAMPVALLTIDTASVDARAAAKAIANAVAAA
ncbi:shikimate kinase [Terricaulis sp.]|uniref:shikimate kinase n=1 Tax=Terricaulis sp. TaxID=2768686 RepID=UPI002AC726C7|nr:shikimate kinase [Terricaulis sp.]MDZ4690262.1 shikimate kinase [Terricaulis sp.]